MARHARASVETRDALVSRAEDLKWEVTLRSDVVALGAPIDLVADGALSRLLSGFAPVCSRAPSQRMRSRAAHRMAVATGIAFRSRNTEVAELAGGAGRLCGSGMVPSEERRMILRYFTGFLRRFWPREDAASDRYRRGTRRRLSDLNQGREGDELEARFGEDHVTGMARSRSESAGGPSPRDDSRSEHSELLTSPLLLRQKGDVCVL